MKFIDVFNGDADGICALVQLRKANPVESELVTGVKRDIQLLKGVTTPTHQQATRITVLDISYEKNTEDVDRLLMAGAHIDYVDHHKTGKINKHPNLSTNINLSVDVCTSLLVDQKLNGQYRAWALTGAYGDNLITVADELATKSGYSADQARLMNRLGHLLNYNAYGDSVDDLQYCPSALYQKICQYNDPFAFVDTEQEIYSSLIDCYESDIAQANAANIVTKTSTAAVYSLPNKKWARRVSGVFSNSLTNKSPEVAHAVIRQKDNGDYVVSIRAPLNNKYGADIVASQFPTGGGRKAAAGINALPETMLDRFCEIFAKQYQ